MGFFPREKRSRQEGKLEKPKKTDCVRLIAARKTQCETKARLVSVGAENSVPQRENEAEIAVPLPFADGVVRAVHVRRNENRANIFLKRLRNGDVGVVENRHAGEQKLKENDPVGRRA